MTLVSTVALGSSTYAWFTLNKEVSVTGMQLKAHSEEGLLINEVKAHDSTTWDSEAKAVDSPVAYALRPASTSDLANWWHANSKQSSIEAGIDNLDQTVALAGGAKYTDLDDTATNKTIIDAEDAASGEKATGNTQAETHVWFTNATYGDEDAGAESDGYENGEGYYVRYTYYLKSSGEGDLVLENLQAQVKAEKKNETEAGDDISTALDGALRVGIAVPASASSSTIAGRYIFAPVTGADSSYKVTSVATGATFTTVTPATATTEAFSAFTRLNLVTSEPEAETTTYATITVPKTTSDGLPVYVYVWFEGEDSNCKSDNLTEVLDSYEITVNFKAADLG
jgi:hypothetical protein